MLPCPLSSLVAQITGYFCTTGDCLFCYHLFCLYVPDCMSLFKTYRHTSHDFFFICFHICMKNCNNILCFGCNATHFIKPLIFSQELLKQHVLERPLSCPTNALEHMPLDIDYLEFLCHQEMVFIEALSEHVQVSEDVAARLTNLHWAIQSHRNSEETMLAFEVQR